jgi:beta-lactamase class A
MVALAAVVLAMAAPGGWAPHVHAAEHYAAQRRGSVSFAVRSADRVWGRRMDRVAPSASTLKLVLLVTELRRVAGRPLSRADRRLLAPMVRRSANGPASALVVRLGRARIEHVARLGGMHSFRLASPWGLSTVTARDLTRFALRVEALVPARHRAYAMRLWRSIVPSQRWGVFRAAPRGWTVHAKGGWGSGSGAVDHQVALLTRGHERVAAAVLTTADGTHAYGKETLRGVFARLLRGLGASGPGASEPSRTPGPSRAR